MRTSEITALSKILGAVATVQAQSELALSFDVVKQRVRDEFDMWVLELECIDLFDLVVIIGGKNAGFIDDLVDFAC
jgi:hypothetical protein